MVLFCLFVALSFVSYFFGFVGGGGGAVFVLFLIVVGGGSIWSSMIGYSFTLD